MGEFKPKFKDFFVNIALNERFLHSRREEECRKTKHTMRKLLQIYRDILVFATYNYFLDVLFYY